MAAEAVLKYLVDTNRPYSCADVTVNLRGAFTKGVIQKTLDALSESGKVKCKLYGKQKVYAPIQSDIGADNSEVEDYDTKIKSITQELSEKSTAFKNAEGNLKVLLSTPTTDTAKTQIDEIKKGTEVYIKKLEVLRDSKEVISAEDKKILLDEHEKLFKEYRKRKRTCNDILEAILEGYPKSKKTFLEELCIETDEMVSFKLMAS